MDIKRVDDRSMLIYLDFVSMVFLVKRRLTQAWPSLSSLLCHTKEKPKIHAKAVPEAKIKGGNVLAVRHGPKVAGAAPEEGAADGVDVRNGSGVAQGRNARGDAQDWNKSRNGAGVARGGNANENMREKTAGDAAQGGRWQERDIRQSVNRVEADGSSGRAERGDSII